MKRFLISAVAAAALMAGITPVAQAAQTVTNTFGVSVTLSGRCTATNPGATSLAFGAYIAFQPTDITRTAAVTFDCTRGLAPTSFSFDTFTTTAGVNAAAGADGILAGLNYHLTTSAASVGGNAASATAGGVGTADAFTVTVTGVMGLGQAGTCGAASATAAACDAGVSNHTRTLTVTY